jgi:hypothetical protein
MSEDLRNLNVYPAFHNFSAGDTSTTEILLPSAATKITVGGVAKEIYVCRNGATDGGSIPTNRATIPSANYLELRLGRGQNRPSSIFVASKSGSAEVSIILEEL